MEMVGAGCCWHVNDKLPCFFDGRGWHHHKVHMNEVSALMPEIIASKKLNGRTSDIIKIQMGVSENRGTPKWMVYNGKPYQNG